MSKVELWLTTTSISIQNLVGTKGVDLFPAQVRVMLMYGNMENGAPCKVQFMRDESDKQGRQFNGSFSYHEDSLVVVIENEDETGLTLVFSHPVSAEFKGIVEEDESNEGEPSEKRSPEDIAGGAFRS